HWVLALDGATPAAVALGFTASAERQGLRVRADYQQLLSREPGQTELDAWVAAFVNGQVANEDVLAGFLSSPEYFQKHSRNPQEWLDGAILDLNEPEGS